MNYLKLKAIKQSRFVIEELNENKNRQPGSLVMRIK